MAKRRGLGTGLDELLGTQSSDLEDPQSRGSGAQLTELRISQIKPNPQQPRRKIDETSLTELAESIKTTGVIQPVVVRPTASGYELVVGERRWRAAQIAERTSIPAIVRDVNDSDALVIALIENLRRADLNAYEEALALKRLQEEHRMSQAEIAENIGKSRVAVANLLRLLNLSSEILDLLVDGQLEEGHARALLGLHNDVKRRDLAHEAAKRKLTVRQLEAKVRQLNKEGQGSPTKEPDADILRLQRDLSDLLGVLVRIKESKKGRSGVLSIHYETLDKLEQVIEKLRRS